MSWRVWWGFGLAYAVVVAMAVVPVRAITYTDLYSITAPAQFVAGSVHVSDATGGQLVGAARTPAGDTDALLFTPPFGAAVNLDPTWSNSAVAFGTNGPQQVGSYYTATDSYEHALLWNGTAASAVDLSPTGFAISTAQATSGTQQVGSGAGTATGSTSTYHALLWTGTAASVVDLNPIGFAESFAQGTCGTQQVGCAAFSPNSYPYAMLWTGTAASAVDLNPNGYTESYANATNGTQQVGEGTTLYPGANESHALLWNGTAASVVDLNPTGFVNSQANATNGTYQVGFGDDAYDSQYALLWSGTAASCINLGSVLPSNFEYSYAFSIVGTSVYGDAYNSATGNYDAIEWNLSAVPEPASVSMIVLVPLALRRRRWA